MKGTRLTHGPSARGSLADWLASRTEVPMRPGSILVHAPATVFQAPGGGESQLVQTARHLEDLGQTIRPFVPWTDQIEQAQLVHLFGMSPEGLAVARIARSRGVPVVLSPICWYDPRSLLALAGSRLRGAWDVTKWGLRFAWPRWPSWRRELLSLADRVLPNSRAEGRQLTRLFGVDPGRVRAVPNGVEPRFAEADAATFRQFVGLEDFVLYAGRIEPRKNLLGVIRAVGRLGVPLVAIGDPVPGFEGYARTCRQAGEGFTRFYPRIEQDDPRLASAYAAARVFALPSWFETPGLAALEAGLAGSAVVVTPYGCTREYFGDKVRYCRPENPGEIIHAIVEAWEHGPDPELRTQIFQNYLWNQVACKTLEVYHELVD